MNKNNTIFIGLDLGDRYTHLAMIDQEGQLIEETRLPTTHKSFQRKFSGLSNSRIALEVGAHSRWISHLLGEFGHDVLVANARKLRVIYDNPRKGDRADAEILARLARLDPKLLSPIYHRSPQAQADLAIVRSRDALVRSRTKLVNHVQGMVKASGARLPSCTTGSFSGKVAACIPEALQPALLPVLDIIASISQQIREYDQLIDHLCKERYPETHTLQQIAGVGSLTALTYILTLEYHERFRRSRDLGPALGLVPKRDQSGDQDPQLRITKTGDPFLRWLLVQSAQYVLGPFGPDCDLRRWGLKLAERGGKNAKKRALVAVARKLAVLLHHLWKTGEVYDPFYQSKPEAVSAV